MGAGLKKDLRVSRVGPGGSLNAFFVFSSGYFTRTCRGKEEGGTSTIWRAVQRRGCMLRSGRMNRSRKRNLLILWIVGAMIYFTGEVSGDIAQLVELRSCNWVVAITGWMSNCPGEDRNMPLKDSTETKKMGCQERRGGRMGSWSRSSMDRTWTIVESAALLGSHLGSLGKRIKLALANSLMHYLPSTLLSEMWQKEGKPMDRPHRLHPVELRDPPKDAFGIQGHRPTIDPVQ
ncbi:hypothetical protein H6P81_021507 [Aristolochia fimbriata]|uniref:Uncharacterized protein n=1 Tax=Aristolochia fimbriata TaxID=158543 RepID=A0AAV7DSD0_ARIFI|nr:hypothetical protein H6P81_021507 [Aristolochia fimbriata]